MERCLLIYFCEDRSELEWYKSMIILYDTHFYKTFCSHSIFAIRNKNQSNRYIEYSILQVVYLLNYNHWFTKKEEWTVLSNMYYLLDQLQSLLAPLGAVIPLYIRYYITISCSKLHSPAIVAINGTSCFIFITNTAFFAPKQVVITSLIVIVLRCCS